MREGLTSRANCQAYIHFPFLYSLPDMLEVVAVTANAVVDHRQLAGGRKHARRSLDATKET